VDRVPGRLTGKPRHRQGHQHPVQPIPTRKLRYFSRLPNDTAFDLVTLDRLEQRLEVSFANAVIALALDELEEHRSQLGRGENPQQQARLAGDVIVRMRSTLAGAPTIRLGIPCLGAPRSSLDIRTGTVAL
jgi:hypothetical protein